MQMDILPIMPSDRISNLTIRQLHSVESMHIGRVAEKKIRELTENARAMLLFAQHGWPSAITPNLWSSALRMANMVHNYVPLQGRK
jgi:hypothetical protein